MDVLLYDPNIYINDGDREVRFFKISKGYLKDYKRYMNRICSDYKFKIMKIRICRDLWKSLYENTFTIKILEYATVIQQINGEATKIEMHISCELDFNNNDVFLYI